MSFAETIKKITNRAADTKDGKKRFKKDQAFLPGVSLDSYLAATKGPETIADRSSIGAFVGSAMKATANAPQTNTLKKAIPALRTAFMNQDIFAYNAAKEKLDKASGKKIPAAPDSVMIRKEARRRADRTRTSSRASTLGLKY
jgi:hypothetical protein